MNIKGNRGFTLIELMIAIFIFSILGGMIFIFINSSNVLAGREHKNYKSRSEARIGMSYVTVKLRQFNEKDVIKITDDNKIIINNGKDMMTIFFEDKVLKESVGSSFKEIANVETFNIIVEDKKTIKIEIGYIDSSGKLDTLTEIITKRYDE